MKQADDEHLKAHFLATLEGEFSTRRHTVSLERVQRIWLGIDNEPMEFTADTLAKMLQEVADQCGEDEAFVLHAVVRALRGKDDAHTLTLRHNRRGKYLSPTERSEKDRLHLNWLHTLAQLEREGVKTEAAVMQIAEREGLGRASIFNGIAEAEARLEKARVRFEGMSGSERFANPRPDKSKKG